MSAATARRAIRPHMRPPRLRVPLLRPRALLTAPAPTTPVLTGPACTAPAPTARATVPVLTAPVLTAPCLPGPYLPGLAYRDLLSGTGAGGLVPCQCGTGRLSWQEQHRQQRPGGGDAAGHQAAHAQPVQERLRGGLPDGRAGGWLAEAAAPGSRR